MKATLQYASGAVRNRKNQRFVSLTRHEANFPLMQVDILPSQRRDIPKPLACVETKENH